MPTFSRWRRTMPDRAPSSGITAFLRTRRRAATSATSSTDGPASTRGSASRPLGETFLQKSLDAVPSVGDLAQRYRSDAFAEERVPDVGINLNFETFPLGRELSADRVDIGLADLLVEAAEDEQQRRAERLRIGDRGGLSAGQRVVDALSVERDGAANARESRCYERGRPAETESPRHHLAEIDEILLVEPIARCRDVAPQAFLRYRLDRFVAAHATFRRILLAVRRVRPVKIIDSESHVAGSGDQIRDAAHLVVKPVDSLEHDHGGNRTSVLGASQVGRHRSAVDVDRQFRRFHGTPNLKEDS